MDNLVGLIKICIENVLFYKFIEESIIFWVRMLEFP